MGCTIAMPPPPPPSPALPHAALCPAALQVDGLHDQDADDAGGVAAGLSLMAHALVDLGAQMGVRLDAFALGPAAQHIGEHAGRGGG
jgi:hypothetical protein